MTKEEVISLVQEAWSKVDDLENTLDNTIEEIRSGLRFIRQKLEEVPEEVNEIENTEVEE